MEMYKYVCNHCGKGFEIETPEAKECPFCFWSSSIKREGEVIKIDSMISNKNNVPGAKALGKFMPSNKWGSAFIGFLFFCGLVVIGAILMAGTAAVSAFLYPIFNVISAAAVMSFFLIILPLSLINSLRSFLAQLTIVLSYVCGVTLWMYSFLVIFNLLGWWAWLLFVWFQAVAPIAATGLLFKKQWAAGGSIILTWIIVYGMRFYSIWLAALYERSLTLPESTSSWGAKVLEKYEKLPEWLRWILFFPLVGLLTLLVGLLLALIFSFAGYFFFVINALVAILCTLFFTKWFAPRWKNRLMMLGLVLRILIGVAIFGVLAYSGEAPNKQAWFEALREAVSLLIGFVVFFKYLRVDSVAKKDETVAL